MVISQLLTNWLPSNRRSYRLPTVRLSDLTKPRRKVREELARHAIGLPIFKTRFPRLLAHDAILIILLSEKFGNHRAITNNMNGPTNAGLKLFLMVNAE